MFDGNGNWTSDFSAISDRDNNIKILASRFDGIFIADIKESFENCLTKDGQIAPIGDFNMGGQKLTNLATGTNDNDAVNVSQIETRLETLLSAVYPVGSIYIGTQNTCPLEGLISGSTWELVASDKALWTGDGTNADTTISAGLPNITGKATPWIHDTALAVKNTSGAFKVTESTIKAGNNNDINANITGARNIDFSASRSNSIYGNSSTVQPPAYVVNVWKRTA